MSFTTQEGVISVIEQMLEKAWPEDCGRVQAPFPRICYQEAMSLYGTDKPDLRISWKVRGLENVLLHLFYRTISIYSSLTKFLPLYMTPCCHLRLHERPRDVFK